MVDITKVKELEQIVMIRQKMVSLGHVAIGLAHEIRSPLSGVSVFLDTIRDNLMDSENIADIMLMVSEAKKAVSKIDSVIKRVLDFSRPNVPNLTLADINMAIEEAIKLSCVALRKRGTKIESALSKDLPKVYIDSQLIEQVILNLINNSSEAMEDSEGEKKISISSSIDTSHIVIRVSDTGKGIPSEIKEKIFEPFYSTKSYGSGIGLSVCQRIIADHGGQIEAGTSKLGGAEFTIKIPIEKRVTYR
jgi:signal transduction histidine kinase